MVMTPTLLHPYASFTVLSEDTELGKHTRSFIIARIPSLLTLDGAAVSDIIQHKEHRHETRSRFLSKNAPIQSFFICQLSCSKVRHQMTKNARIIIIGLISVTVCPSAITAPTTN
jgi:hypothetical protein